MANKNYISGSLVQVPPTFTTVTTGSDEYSVEFNDANATQLSWQNSRYHGKQLFTTELNKVSSTTISGSGSVAGEKYIGPIENGETGSIIVLDETGYGNTACTQKYTRNIYLGNAIIGMNNNGEDTSLVNFPEFSYVQTNTYYTINSDDNIVVNRLESTKDNFDSRRGFYRKFYEDFPIGETCKIVLNDTSIKSNLKENHIVFFNGGQLKKIITLTPGFGIGSSIFYTTSSNVIEFTAAEQTGYIDPDPPNGNPDSIFSSTASIFNPQLTYNFFTSSIEDFTRERLVGNPLTTQVLVLRDALKVDFFEANKKYKDKSTYRGDKRIFVSFCSSSTQIDTDNITGAPRYEGIPINTNIKYNIPTGSAALVTNNLAQLSTTEVMSTHDHIGSGSLYHTTGLLALLNTTSFYISCSEKHILNQNYAFKDQSILLQETVDGDLGTPVAFPNTGAPFNFASGSVTISLCDDSIPSLLVPLDKSLELLDGIGQKGFVIIPSNLHPHIKQNLTHYLARAGVSLGVDVVPAADNEFKKLR